MVLAGFNLLGSFEKMSLVRFIDQHLQLVILSLQVLADVKQFFALVFPQVTLDVLSFQSLHLDSEAIQSLIRLILQESFLFKFFPQFGDLFGSLVLDHKLNFILLGLGLQLQRVDLLVS